MLTTMLSLHGASDTGLNTNMRNCARFNLVRQNCMFTLMHSNHLLNILWKCIHVSFKFMWANIDIAKTLRKHDYDVG